MFCGVDSMLREVFYNEMSGISSSTQSTATSMILNRKELEAMVYREGPQDRMLRPDLESLKPYLHEYKEIIQERTKYHESLVDSHYQLQQADYCKLFTDDAVSAEPTSYPPKSLTITEPSSACTPHQLTAGIAGKEAQKEFDFEEASLSAQRGYKKPATKLITEKEREWYAASEGRGENDISGISLFLPDHHQRPTTSPTPESQEQYAEGMLNHEVEMSNATLYMSPDVRRPGDSMIPDTRQSVQGSRIGLQDLF